MNTATNKSAHGKWKIAVLLILLVGVISLSFVFPVKDYLKQVLEWVEGLGWLGSAAVVGLYVIACVLFLPGSVITVGAGAIFGLPLGFLTVTIGANLGAIAAFGIGRTFARSWVESKVTDNPKFKAIDDAVGRDGFKIVFLTRLSPVFPFNLLNFMFGVTRVRFRDYVLGNLFGMLPGTLLYVYLGAAAGSFSKALAQLESGSKSTGEYVLLGVGLVVTIIVTVFVTRIAKRSLAEALDSTDSSDDHEKEPEANG